MEIVRGFLRHRITVTQKAIHVYYCLRKVWWHFVGVFFLFQFRRCLCWLLCIWMMKGIAAVMFMLILHVARPLGQWHIIKRISETFRYCSSCRTLRSTGSALDIAKLFSVLFFFSPVVVVGHDKKSERKKPVGNHSKQMTVRQIPCDARASMSNGSSRWERIFISKWFSPLLLLVVRWGFGSIRADERFISIANELGTLKWDNSLLTSAVDRRWAEALDGERFLLKLSSTPRTPFKYLRRKDAT